jgi:pimeloyl-ACP methyl ester carboxylesterase
MAYMDIPPATELNGKTVVLLHGKAFGCYYFANVIEALTGAGYRVVAPDQIGWASHPSPASTTASSCSPRTPRPCWTTSASRTSPCWTRRYGTPSPTSWSG